MSTLATQGLIKRFGRSTVVDDVDVSVSGGEIVGLLGPNGAGKTTCFYMICGLVRRDGGAILLDGQDISHLPMHERARKGIGYLPQEASIFRRLTVRENLLAVLEAVPGLDRAAREQRADDMLDKFGIIHKSADYGYSLSGGERRRVEIARAVSLQPSFMLLDEPFAGIDPISIIDIQRLISDLKAMGIGVLITDHNVRETLGICDRAYILTQGRVLTEGTAEHILAHEEVRSVYLGTGFRL
ncbi:MAG: LPS export ABC transporter ATP-binding protein [Gammaproteobacteria bacterium]|nr:LPS export ABC transporter ATP-binding protein [Gammaproteobacteria bacterium]NDG44097.1 LPS export ABC transporter ATP-binding protein [Gammaproteobacteria bacterium]